MRKNVPKNHRNKGIFPGTTRLRISGLFFTILELLMVLAVIVLLCSLLLPALNKAKSTSRKIICLNNLKQIGTGLSMYMSDNNGHTLPGYYTGISYWPPVIDEYIGGKGRDISYKGVSAKVWACPENNRTIYDKLQSGTYSSGFGISTGYPANMHIRTESASVGIRNSRINNPSSLIYIPEVKHMDSSVGPLTAIKYAHYGFDDWSYSKHGKGSNFLYIDVHASWQPDSSPERSFDASTAMPAWIP